MPSDFIFNDLETREQRAVPFIGGSPEGVYKAPPGWLLVDEIACTLYQKTTPTYLSTGWVVRGGSGTSTTPTGAVDPNGVVPGAKGSIYTQVVGNVTTLWINVDGGTTWV